MGPANVGPWLEQVGDGLAQKVTIGRGVEIPEVADRHLCSPKASLTLALTQSSSIRGPTGIRVSGSTNVAVMRGRCGPSRTATASTASSQVRRMTSGPWSTRQMMRMMSSSACAHSGCGTPGRRDPDLGRVTRPDDGRGMSPETAGPVRGEAGGRVAGQDVRLAHDAGQRPQQRARKHHHPPSFIGPPVPGQADRPHHDRPPEYRTT
jgi:hypothetical protein